MVAWDFEHAFPAFVDTATVQPYDTQDGAAAALSDLKRAVSDDADEAGIATLLSDVEAAVLALVTQIMPSEDSRARIEYTVDGASGMRVSIAQQIVRLRALQSQDDIMFRVANATLEQTFQALLDHLTAARVAEEMDAPTYVERLRGGFRRVRDGAALQRVNLEMHAEAAKVILGRMEIALELSIFLERHIAGQSGKAHSDAHQVKQQAADLVGLTTKSCDFAAHFVRFIAISLGSVTGVEQALCADANIAGAERESVLVSRELERHALFRPLPILWALVVAFLVKIVLAHNTSITLHSLAIPILVCAFVLTWGISIYIGVWTRTRRMRDLQNHIRAQFRQILQDNKTTEELIEFPAIGVDVAPQDRTPISVYAYRGKVIHHKWQVALRNLWALAIPAVLLLAVLISRQDGEHRFVAQLEGSQPCVLARGNLVFATRRSFYVTPVDRPVGFWKSALGRAFPELLADVVPRASVIGVTQTKGDLRACVASDPDHNRYTLVHSGSALGAWDAQQTIELFANRLENLTTAINGGDTIAIDITGGAETSPAKVTVDLGETSLNALTQAINGTSFAQLYVNNPVIVDARNAIALALSQDAQSSISIDAIRNAFAVIRAEIGPDLTLSQSLQIAFGGVPGGGNDGALADVLMSLFAGDNTLMTELAAIRLALEKSAELAQTFVTLSEAEADQTATLNTQIGLMVAGHEQVLASLTATLSQIDQDAFVVAPVVVDRAGQETGTPDWVAANLFQTTITLEGESDQVDTIANTLVLPFFPTPVTTGTGALQTPQGAFAWGSDATRLRDPVVLDDGTTYFARIAQTLESCLAQDATVTIDLLGLASRSWDDAGGTVSEAALNYHLAEGRRVGALRKIASLIDDADARARLLVTRAGDDAIPLPAIIASATGPSAVADILAQVGRYAGIAGFETRRDTLLSVTGLNPDTVSPLEELFGRSVVLRMVSTDGGPCQF